MSGKEGPPERGSSWAGRIYAALLRLFPSRFRWRYGPEMQDFFEAAWAEARGFGRVRVLARAIRDALVHGSLERAGVGWWADKGRRTTMGMGTMRDVRLAMRAMRRRPGLHAIAVLTIALGIGSASAVFAVLDAVVFRPVPYPEADRLVATWTRFEGQGDFGLSRAELWDWADESRAFEAMGSFYVDGATLTGLGEARELRRAWTWGDTYGVIDARTVLGRLPGPEDAHTGSAPVVVVSYDLWRNEMASDPNAVGTTLELDARTTEVIGVMDPAVRLPTMAVSLWQPMARDRADISDRSGHLLDGVARLAPGATMRTVLAEIEEIHTRWDEAWAGVHSPGHEGHTLAAQPLHERYFGELRSAGSTLMASVLLVLLLACANVASLLMARGETRASDLALRRALGASRGAIARQLLVESLVLSALGGVLGLGLAWFGVDVLMALEPGNLPRTDTVGLDGRVLAFTFAATLASGLVFGILPALRAASARPTGRRGAAGPDRGLSRSLSGLVVGQVALAIVLLSGAGLLTRSVRALAGADPGLETEDRLTFRVALSGPSYPDMTAVNAFWDRLLGEVRALPGVERAAAVRLLPLRDGLRQEGMLVPGGSAEPGESEAIAYEVVTPEYFETLGVGVVRGRAFESGDRPGTPWVGLVNESAARAFWDDGNPVGRPVEPLFVPRSSWPVTIVGVVSDAHVEGVRTEVVPTLYLAYAQSPANTRAWVSSGTVVVHASVAPTSLVPAVRQIMEDIDARVPVTNVDTYETVRAGERARERFLATVLGVFAVLALMIAAMGTYGVVAFSTARRTRELGVRIALGASRQRIVHGVLRAGVGLAIVGAGVGLAGALLGGSLLESFLFGVSRYDALSMGVAPVAMTAVVLLACALPALRATRVDPLEALRDE